MKIDRAYQRKLLQACADVYPSSLNEEQLQAFLNEGNGGYRANSAYLDELGLLRSIDRGHILSLQMLPSITAKGLDFLADDGGLTAILGVVTVKIHEESIRALLLQKVETLPIDDPEERSALSEAVRNLPGRSLQTLVDKLIGLGVEHLPSGAHALHTWINQAISSAHGLLG